MGPGHVCGHTIIVYFQRNESLGITNHCGNGKNPFPALVERGQADEDPAFVCLASQRRNGGLGPLLNLSGRSSLVVQKCACVRTLFILALLVIYKLKQIIVETFATMEKGCLQSGRKQTK